MAIIRRGKIWRIISGDLIAEVDLRAGGKIRCLRSRPSGRDFFFHDQRRHSKGKDYPGHELGGCDELFPQASLAAQAYGVLWDGVWEGYTQGQQLITRISRPHQLPVIVSRVLSAPGSNRLHLDYTVVNIGREPLPFVYAHHPLLAIEPRSRLTLAGVKQLSVLKHNGLLKAGMLQAWPIANLKDGGSCRLDTNFSSDRKISGQWVARHCSHAHVTFPETGEKLLLSWDREHLPFLGLWLSLGIPGDPKVPDPKFWNWLSLLPTSLDNGLPQPGQAPELQPGEPFSFWIEWELKSRWKKRRGLRRQLWLKRVRRLLPRE